MAYNHSRAQKTFQFKPVLYKGVWPPTYESFNQFMAWSLENYWTWGLNSRVLCNAEVLGLMCMLDFSNLSSSYESFRKLWWVSFVRSEEYDKQLKDGKINRDRRFERNWEQLAKILTKTMEEML